MHSGSRFRLSIKLLLLLAGSSMPGAGVRAEFVPKKAPAELNALSGSVFGYVTVPLHHAAPGAGTIRVAVLILKARSARPATDPVLFFVGGPGGGATGFSGFPLFTALAQDRDVVLADPRGCGLSRPNLHFREHDKENPAREARLNRRWFRDAGIDVAAFNASEIAQDYEAVRLALGYGKVNVLANSFGTFEAQEYLRHFPASIRSLVMTGNLAASNDLISTVLQTQAHAFRAFLTDVRRNRAARRDFPNFTHRFWSLVRKLNLHQRHLELTDAAGSYVREVDGFAFLAKARSMLIYTPDTPYLPLLVDSLEHHRRDAIVRHAFGREVSDPRDDSDGEYNSVSATAYARPGFQRDGVRALRRLANRTLADTLGPDFLAGNRFLALWGVPFAPGTTRTLPHGDMPALLLSGEFDTQTPPSDALRIASGLTRATNYTYPRTGHGVGFFGGPDMEAAIAFIKDPSRPPAYTTGNLLRRHFYRRIYP